MTAAVNSVNSALMGLREASRVYNMYVETLRRCVHGFVELNCKPGPCTVLVLTDEEKDRLAGYLVEMADIGYMASVEKLLCRWHSK